METSLNANRMEIRNLVEKIEELREIMVLNTQIDIAALGEHHMQIEEDGVKVSTEIGMSNGGNTNLNHLIYAAQSQIQEWIPMIATLS